MTWQDRFYQLMAESKYGTINDLCKAAGIASSTFGNALKGSHVPKPVTMEKVANVLGTTWQYLINGDESQSVPDTQVPVMDADNVLAWLDGSLNFDSYKDKIHSPFPVKAGCFAWRVSTVDMEPEFHCSDYVLLDSRPDYAVRHVNRRLFVLVGMINTPGHIGMTDIGKIFNDTVSGQPATDTKSVPISYSDITLCELCKTVQGFQLMSGDRRFSTPMDAKKHRILAQARYGITVY